MNTTILCGGEFGGIDVDQTNWPVGEIRKVSKEGLSLFYRNDEGDHAIFIGTTYDGSFETITL